MIFGKRIITARQFVGLCAGKAGLLPAGQRWDRARFAAQGARLVRTLVRTSRAVQAPATRELAKKISKLIQRQILAVVDEAMHQLYPGKAAVIDTITLDSANIWARAIEEAFRREGIQATVDLQPPIQSVMSQAYSKTSIILGHAGETATTVNFAARASQVARRISGMNETTKDRIGTLVNQAVNEGLSHGEMARSIVEAAPKMGNARAMTISRTELNRAWFEGSLEGMQEGGEVLTAAVIGCESREEDLWDKPYYADFLFSADGRAPESSCNIEGVPVLLADKLNFHPNHTGTVVPDTFRDDKPDPAAQ